MGNQSEAGLNIVLIEDNPSDVFLMRLALEENGLRFNMTNFTSGADALATLCTADDNAHSSEIPDIILLDLNTPRSNGFEVLAKLRHDVRLSRVPVAVVTSSATPSDQRRAELLGATSYIQKPTQLTDFISGVGTAIKAMLAQEGKV
jgi:CheY-like chemotaxis protein